MWKCTKCETLNRDETCTACGAHWTTGQMLEHMPEQETYDQPSVYPNTPYTYQSGYGEAERNRTKEQNNNGLIITVVICVTIIVALLLGIGAYIFVQDDDVVYGDGAIKSEPSAVAYVPTQTPSAVAIAEPTPEPTIAPSATPTPKPAPVYDGAAKRQAFLTRASDIESYAETAGESAMTQMEINQVSAEIYSRWDGLLNDVYQYLKSVLPSGEFAALKKEELAWIKRKEAAVAEEGEAWGSGSGRPMAENSVASDYTRERCYELIDMIP